MIVVSATGTQSPSSVIANASNAYEAAEALVRFLVAQNRCFSSGEVCAYIRTYRSDLSFSATNIGGWLRAWYDNDNSTVQVPVGFPEYTDATGSTVYPAQVARTTSGVARTLDGRKVTTRTPAGITVFVYAPDAVEGYAHDFEVYVPEYDDPQASRATLYTGAPITAPAVVTTTSPSGAPVVKAQVTPKQANLITGRLTQADLTAYVPSDASGSTSPRVTVPRLAFEAWVNLTGRPITGGPNGDPLYVTATGNIVSITRDPTPTSTEYKLWNNRGRLAIAGLSVSTGDKFRVKVSTTDIQIDLSAKV